MAETFNFTPEFEDLILASYVSSPEDFLIYGNLLKGAYFSSAPRVMVLEATNSCLVNYGYSPSWEALGQMVADRAKDHGLEDSEYIEYVRKISQIDVRDTKYVTERLITFCRERATVDAVKKAIRCVKGEDKMPSGGLAPLFEEALKIGINLDDMGCLVNSDFERVIDKALSPEYGMKTGIPQFDAIWKNGWLPGWLVVPVAPPKRYKSLFCTNVGLSAAGHQRGHDVIYYTCEISQTQAVSRALFNLTGLTEESMFNTTQAFRESAKEAIRENLAGRFLVKEFPLGTASIADLQAHTRLVKKSLGLNPRLIIIDYADTVRPSDTNQPQHIQQANVYKEAIAFGKREGATILMPDRCTAAAVDLQVPNLKSFQGAFAKGGLLDIAIGLCATDTEYAQKKQRTFVFVNRHGEAYQHFDGTVDPARAKISIGNQIEWTPDEESSGGEGRGGRGSGGGRGGRREPQNPELAEE